MIAAEVVRGGGECELPHRAGSVERDGLLILQQAAEKGMVIVLLTWKVGEEAMDSHRKEGTPKIFDNRGGIE